MSKTKRVVITRTIWLLSLVSLFTDVASEMLYPIMPIYLKSIGFSVVLIGVLEGFAEAVAGLSKGYFGNLSDSKGKRLPFVQLGYLMSAISKPMMAVWTAPLWIFGARTVDRLGKGVRTGARDALLSDESTPETKGQVFGFHRSLDTLGAVLGPASALLFLYYWPNQYQALFMLAFIPGLLAIGCTFLIKEKDHSPTTSSRSTSFWGFLHYWKSSPAQYRELVTGLLLFTLVNSSDVFLLLKIKETGWSDTTVIGVYIFYNLVYALLSYPVGLMADRIGLKKGFIGGLLVFALVYTGMAFTTTVAGFLILFAAYGLYASATEGISKAWIATIADGKQVATAIGTYSAFQSICTMLASALAGYLWYEFGAEVTFLVSGAVTLGVAAYLMTFRFTTL